MALIFRTDDLTKWGTGKGDNLAPVEFDLNFWQLLERVAALESTPAEARSIDTFSVVGNQFTVTMSDATTEGPFTLPVSNLIFRDTWLPSEVFVAQTVFWVGDTVYITLLNHETALTFDPDANDGLGHNYYRKIFGPQSVTPNDVHMFIGGIMFDDQLIFYTEATRAWQLPASLTGSRFRSRVAAADITIVTLKKNASDIGTITWALGGFIPTVSFASAVSFAIGDSFSVHGPAVSDTTLADTAFDFLGTRI